eukprot:11094582-Karenia_brevis.AAC.1
MKELSMRQIPSIGEPCWRIFGFDRRTRPGMVHGNREDKVEEWEGEFLGKAEATEFRGLAARLYFMSLDWPDLQFAIQQCGRDMANPKAISWRAQKK